MELITEMIYTRLLETYPLQSPGQFRNHPLRAVYFDSLEEEWEDGILYLVEDPAREPQCLRSQAKAAFFCFWEIREIPENTAGDIVCLTEQASARLLLNDINRIFSDFEQWEQELDRSPYTEEGIREMLKTAKKKMRGRISLTDIYLNYVMYNTNIRTFSPGNSRSSSKITDEEEILDLLDDPQFYQYEKVRGVFYYSSINYATLCYNLYKNEKFCYRLIYNNFRNSYSPEESHLFGCLGQKISRLVEYIPAMTAPIPPDSPVRNSIHEIISGKQLPEKLLTQQLREIGWSPEDSYYLILMEYYFISSEYDAPLYHGLRLEYMYPESIAVKSHQGLFLVLNTTRNSKHEDYGFLDTFPAFIRESMYKCGISALFQGFSNLSLAFRQADFALQYGLSHMDSFWYFKFEDFYLQYMTQQISEKLPVRFICHPGLFRLLEYDARNESQLYETLQVYMNCKYNSSEAARLLHIHRTTLLYRLEKIYEMADIDLEDADTRLHLLLSFQLLGETAALQD